MLERLLETIQDSYFHTIFDSSGFFFFQIKSYVIIHAE